jgi:hypothetical protein
MREGVLVKRWRRKSIEQRISKQEAQVDKYRHEYEAKKNSRRRYGRYRRALKKLRGLYKKAKNNGKWNEVDRKYKDLVNEHKHRK